MASITTKFYGKTLLCFSREELNELLKAEHFAQAMDMIAAAGRTPQETENDKLFMDLLVQDLTKKTVKDRDMHEIFAALFLFHDLHDPKTEICFEVRYDLKKDGPISTLKELNKFREGTFTDFIYKSPDGFRQYQLKRYMHEATAEAMTAFIREQIEHYANDLGAVNLLLIMQVPGAQIEHSAFEQIRDNLREISFKSEGHIIIMFATHTQKITAVEVYPEVRVISVPARLPSEQLKSQNPDAR